METVSSEGLLVLHSSDEFTGGFFTTWGEWLSGVGKREEDSYQCADVTVSSAA